MTQNVSPNPRILLTMGDPAGIGPEVLLRALVCLPADSRISVVGDPEWLRGLARRLALSIPWSRIRWLDAVRVPATLSRGGVSAEAGRVAYLTLEVAVRCLQSDQGQALVTAPVSKEAIVRAGIPWVGHTEYLARRCRVPTTMMFVSGSFRVSLVTRHVGIRRLPERLKRQEVLRVLQATHQALSDDFGIRTPRLALAALNPHAGEGGLFGGEEKEILIPAVRACRFKVEGPLAADSLMEKASRGAYDAVVALYHDQALIPLKLIGWRHAVNVTLGLPFVRTSPVHGTAFDIAGKGRADPAPMRAAIRLAVELVRRRVRGR